MNDVADTPAQRLADRLDSRQAVVGVIGLGYVGLPLALTFAETGFPVLGFDTDGEKIALLETGGCYVGHIEADRVRRAVEEGGLRVTAELGRLAEPDVLIICVPTPLTPDKEPDLRYVERTITAIAATLRPGQLIVLESTTYPGTCDEVVLPILRHQGLRPGVDYFLAYSPEREDPGNPVFSTASIPKVVGGADAVSGDLAQSLYGHVVPEVVRVSSPSVAEATKLTENIFRAVNIALVNELKMVYDRLGIDIWEVLDAAATKPFGFMRFSPGPGWGGHCIPIDPFYLSWRAKQAGENPRFIELAGEINTAMPGWVLDKLESALLERGTPLSDARVLILGLAYKPDVDDPRESPAFELMDRLLEAGAEVSYHDPLIPKSPTMRSWPKLPELESVRLTAETLRAVDAVVLVTDHTNVDYELVACEALLLLDTRGVIAKAGDNVVRA